MTHSTNVSAETPAAVRAASVLIREEAAGDHAAVRALNRAAFETAAEARLVEALREQASPLVSLVADQDGTIVGHILFSPVKLSGHEDLEIMGLAPMAVAPSRQRQGIGSELVRAGLERCRVLGVSAVVVLGHPAFYPRFGFVPSVEFDIVCEYDVPVEAFMIVELEPGFLHGKSGTIRYHRVFAEL